MTNKFAMPFVMMFYFLICLLAMIWPGATLANRIDPMILGLPFFIFWYLLWSFLTFIGLVICYRAQGSVDDE